MRPLPRPEPGRGPVLRRPRRSTALTVAVGLATFAFVHDVATAIHGGDDRWGDPMPVVVATRDVGAGEVLRAADLEMIDAPASIVPPGALVAAPVGRTARAPLGRGEIVTQVRVGTATGIAALLAPDERAVAVPRLVSVPPVEVGTTVDLLATDDATGATRAVAARARVVGVDDDAVVVAVDPTTALVLTEAVRRGVVSIVVTP